MPSACPRSVLLAALVTLLPAASANELAPLFTSPVFDTGIGPNQAVVADFDGDGLPDAATANYGLGTVSLLRGNGLGGFLAPQDVSVGQYAMALAAGDFNHDRHLDLVVGKDGASTVAVLLGDGAGGFAPALQLAVGSSPRSVAVGDVNGDGHLDAVAANTFSNSVSVLLGDGAGGFAPAVSVAVGANPSAVALADVDGDKVLDLLAANEGSASITLRSGNGAGGFGPATTLVTGAQPSGLAVADLDGDGWPEVASSNMAGTVSVFANTGSGIFAPALTLPAGGGCSALSASDVNGDGRPDLLVSNQANVVLPGSVSVLLNAGALAFAPAKAYLVGPLAYDVTAADLDADGDMDVLSASGQSGLSVLLGDGSGSFRATATYGAGGGSARSLATGRFDADARSDVAFVRPAGIGVLLDDGHGGLATPVSLAGSSGTWSVAVGDLDNDGRDDIVGATGTPATMKAWLGDGAGGFSLASSQAWPASSWDVVLADVDRDGHLDVVSADSGISVALGLGDGSFSAPATWPAAGVSRLKVGRLDADAWPDVVAVAGAQVLVRLNDGAGGFPPALSLAASSATTDVALGDVNADGLTDVVAGHLSGSFCSLWTGDGLGGFGAEQKVTIDFAPHAVWVADFDADGDDDLAAAGYNSWTLSLRRSDGAGGLLPLETYTLATNAWTMTDGDFDGDNGLDLAIGNAEQGSITVVLNQGGAAPWLDLQQGLAGTHGVPWLSGASGFAPGAPFAIAASGALESTAAWLVFGPTVLGAPFKGGTLVPVPQLVLGGLLTDVHGDLAFAATWPAGVPAGVAGVLQAWFADPAGAAGFAASNGLQFVVP